MRLKPNPYCERFRSAGPNGCNSGFFEFIDRSPALRCQISDGLGWDHVSVSTEVRVPTWQEMCRVKQLFFEPEECVMQLHPPESIYVNNMPFCLHLWRPQADDEIQRIKLEWGDEWPYGDLICVGNIPLPPIAAVGILTK